MSDHGIPWQATPVSSRQKKEDPATNYTSDTGSLPQFLKIPVGMEQLRSLPVGTQVTNFSIHNGTKTAVHSSSSPQNQSSNLKIQLASVPTQKLSSRSIISLDPNIFGTDRIKSSVDNSIVESTRTSVQQIQQPPTSINSLACDATLAAQQQLREFKRIRNSKFEKSSDGMMNPLIGTKPGSSCKRTFDMMQASHKHLQSVSDNPATSYPDVDSDLTLQEYFTSLLESRGYSSKQYSSLESGYNCKPTDLQKASYGMKFIEVVRASNESLLKKLLDAGLSPNPCNNFGESILHMICRRGDHKLLQIFLDYGCSVQISDDFGRTPLHDACWTTRPCFKCVEMLLNRDRWLLHIMDCRGSTPLSYVKKENWNEWKQFLDRQKDVWWPCRDLTTEGEESPPDLVRRPPHSRSLPDPPGAPSCEYARAIASGQVELDSSPSGENRLEDSTIANDTTTNADRKSVV